jgi:hypothetical protein
VSLITRNMAARTLKIKTGTANRTRKELAAYISELDNEKAKLETMKAGGSDRSQIKQQVPHRPHRTNEAAYHVWGACTTAGVRRSSRGLAPTQRRAQGGRGTVACGQ